MSSKQDLVVTQKRYMTKVRFESEAGAYTLGVTASAFDAIGGITGEKFVQGITNNTAALSTIIWTCSNTSGYTLSWGGTVGMTAMSLHGANGSFSFERATLKNNAAAPDGTIIVAPNVSQSGNVILEFVHASGSVGINYNS